MAQDSLVFTAAAGSSAPDPDWSFSGLTQRQTGYATHSYHRYPAKFIPQLAARLINEYSAPGTLVIDPFMGSGTTLVEAKLLKRPSIGVDINPAAHLIARAKVTAIEPSRLSMAIRQLEAMLQDAQQLALFERVEPYTSCDNELRFGERLRYWFDEVTLSKLAWIQSAIDNTALEEDTRDFFYCALSHVLKPLSFWHDRSVKPTRRLSKEIPDARDVFLKHVARMQRGNLEFWQLLNARSAVDVPAVPHCADARQIPVESETAALVVTSPPYVTSYEYADLHQLSVLWFRWASDLRTFREGFIGRSNGAVDTDVNPHSPLAEQIVAQVEAVNPRKAREIALYFSEMYACFKEIRRVLLRRGYVCVIIGNTSLCGVSIQNFQVFNQQLSSLGFKIVNTILREIPSKILPKTRDKATGRFAKTKDADYTAYPMEYILIARKE